MMPQTVPKSPMNGHAAAVVARKVMYLVSRESSTPIARSRARSIPEMLRMRKRWERVTPLAVAPGSSGRFAFTCASSSA